jgi:glycosyltransferase involved in cell wall biosynthesis
VAKKLLVDLTPFDTPSRMRGIGRYIRELALGLTELPARELEGIELLGLTSLGWTGEARVTADLASFEGSPALTRPDERDSYRWAYRQRVALWRALRRLRVDAFHQTDHHATPLLMGWSGAKRIATCHDLVGSRFPEHYFGAKDGGAFVGSRIERRRYASADLVVAISDATRVDATRFARVPADRMVRVYPAVDVERWAGPPTQSTATVLDRHGLMGKRFALYVGGCDWRKNLEGMIGGLAVARAAGDDIVLAWAGSLDAHFVARIESEAQRAGVADRVTLLRFVSDDDLSVLYREAVAHLFVSRCEGFGLTVVEAMASGCPVITTTGGSLGEVAGDAALLVDPDDHAAIGAALLRLRDERPLADALRVLGRLRAPKFSRHVQATAMARVYRNFFNLPEPPAR